MRRPISYIGQSVYEWLFTRPAQDNMVALGKLAAAVLGTTTMANGLAVTPTSPASLQVNVAPGEIYALAALEATAYGSLPADTTHQIVKQGISLDTVPLTITPPGTAGQSINYLVQATFAEQDISVDPTSGNTPVVLQFYNSSNPQVPWSGPGGNGQSSNTFRQGSVVLTAKAGIAATTGSQVTPAPDAGNIGLYVVTVANGQSTITAGNISLYAGAPIIAETLTQKISQTVADARYVQQTNLVTAVSDPTFSNNSSNSVSSSWVRGAMSAIATAAGFVASFGTNGYVKLPSWLGSLIIEWGQVSYASGTTTQSAAVTFPLSFPTAVRGVSLVNSGWWATCSSLSNTGFTAVSSRETGGLVGAGTGYWIAIGN